MTKKPVLTDILYKGESIPEILKLYEEQLRKAGDLKALQHANFISQYRKTVLNTRFLGCLRKHFNEIYKLIEKEFPSVLFHIEGRRKSLISTEKKIIKSLDENKSLDTLRDLLAFRLIIFDKNDEKSVFLCYSIIQKIIEYGIENGFILCEANPVENCGFDNSENKIFIPNESKIKEEFKYGIKDYIMNPKENGYQSLHIAFRLSSGLCFEVQVRTMTMHINAESGEAGHAAYKENEYADFEFDRNKIRIPGYGISPDGTTVHDMVGLEKALLILQRQKTFTSPSKKK